MTEAERLAEEDRHAEDIIRMHAIMAEELNLNDDSIVLAYQNVCLRCARMERESKKI